MEASGRPTRCSSQRCKERSDAPQPPGSPFWYSNPGYELLGDVIESVTGRPLESYLEEHVLRPMGMTHSAASVVTADHGVDVRGHRPPQDDALWRGQTEQTPDVLFPTCTADGAIAATPEDMGDYLRFLLNRGAEDVLGSDDFARLSAPPRPRRRRLVRLRVENR